MDIIWRYCRLLKFLTFKIIYFKFTHKICDIYNFINQICPLVSRHRFRRLPWVKSTERSPMYSVVMRLRWRRSCWTGR